ncbi:hypothetical protein KAR91_62430 [Candidatus Pacearchaeota archaeon]|nr:hypothetical protein [Candidatus Pacearchaeota archaeon]
MSTTRKINGVEVDIMAQADVEGGIIVNFCDQQYRMRGATPEEISGPIIEAQHMLEVLGFKAEKVSNNLLTIKGHAGLLRVMEIMASQSPDVRWM